MTEKELRRYSKIVVDGNEQAPSRAMLRAVGFTEEDFQRPQIGIASTWSMVTPCNMHIGGLAEEAAQAADAAGGKGVVFNTISVSDGISMGTPGMRYSLVSREIIAESIEARFRLLEIADLEGNRQARTQIQKDLVYVDATAGAQRTDRTRYLAAIASLELAEPVRRSFMAMKISQPLAESMELKKSLMEDVLKVYGDAAKYGVAEVTTAATFRLGEVYQQFSRDLMASERPKNLDEMALDQYDMLLEEQTFPFEEKAIELYEANASRAADGVYDEWVERSFAALAGLLPARYAKLERSEDVVTALY